MSLSSDRNPGGSEETGVLAAKCLQGDVRKKFEGGVPCSDPNTQRAKERHFNYLQARESDRLNALRIAKETAKAEEAKARESKKAKALRDEKELAITQSRREAQRSARLKDEEAEKEAGRRNALARDAARARAAARAASQDAARAAVQEADEMDWENEQAARITKGRADAEAAKREIREANDRNIMIAKTNEAEVRMRAAGAKLLRAEKDNASRAENMDKHRTLEARRQFEFDAGKAAGKEASDEAKDRKAAEEAAAAEKRRVPDRLHDMANKNYKSTRPPYLTLDEVYRCRVAPIPPNLLMASRRVGMPQHRRPS